MKNELDFLDSYWTEAKKTAKRAKEKLHILKENKNKKSTFNIVNYSDITDSWNPKDLNHYESENLKILADKIEYMISRNRADSIKDMIIAISTGRIKKHIKIKGGISNKNESLGFGSFRHNFKTYTLNKKEIIQLKKHFKI